MGIDKIILSCNEDPTYLHFWPHVAWAYKKIFPDVEIMLAFLTDRKENDPLVIEYKKYGTVKLFHIHPVIPQFAQAKMIRFILASQQDESVCYVDDVDLFPLSKTFITDKTDKRPNHSLLCVGGEVYHNNGCYPVSQMTAEGKIWKKFINPDNLEWPELMESYIKPVKYDRREDPMIKLDFANDNYFSDERLIRRLREENPVPVFEQKRGYENYLEATIDRATWQINEEKLFNHGYVNAHCGRPYDERDHVLLKEYITRNYGK